MRDLEGKLAVITGGASGIGRGIAHAVADAGMHVVVADIEAGPAEAVADELKAKGVKAIAAVTDVTDRSAVDDVAAMAYSAFGEVHLLCNNAGVVVTGTLDTMTNADWEWLLAVNLDGVINGLQAFLPRMRDQKGEKHIVNTASGAGLFPPPGLGVYNATKYAVVGISETLRDEGAAYGLGVSVLCPGVVRTNIVNCDRNRPAAFGGPVSSEEGLREMPAGMGMDPLEVGRIVRDAVIDNELYILPHPELRPLIEARFEDMLAAFDRAATRRQQGA